MSGYKSLAGAASMLPVQSTVPLRKNRVRVHVLSERTSSHPVVSGHHLYAVRIREWRERRHGSLPFQVLVNVGEHRLDPGDQRFAVKQFADCNGLIVGGVVTISSRTPTQIGIEIGRGGNATGERSVACFKQYGLCGWKNVKVRRDGCHLAGIGHIA
jgi:hypothetical protein